MPTTLDNLRVYAGILFEWKDETDNGSIVFRDRGHVVLNRAMGSGSADLEADQVWHSRPGDYRRLAAGANVTFDLTALTLELLGYTATLDPFVEIRSILVINRTTVQNSYLLLGAAASNEFHAPFGAAGDTVRVAAGSQVMLSSLVDGWPVSGSAKNLKIANPSAVDVDYEICILGTTAASTSSSS